MKLIKKVNKMKIKTTTLLASTLVVLLSMSQSAMALNESTSGYETLTRNNNTSSQVMAMKKVSFLEDFVTSEDVSNDSAADQIITFDTSK